MTEKFFLVPYQTDVMIEELSQEFTIPDNDSFTKEIPPIATISGALEKLDATSAKALRKYGREFSRLVDHQNKIVNRLNNIVSYLLLEQNNDCNIKTTKLSGSGLVFRNTNSYNFKIGNQLRFKLFMYEYGLFVFGYGVVTNIMIDPIPGNKDLIEVDFTKIQPQDQERIIQAMTREQQKMLQERSQDNQIS